MRAVLTSLLAAMACAALLLAFPPAAEAQARKTLAKQNRTLCVHNVPGDGALDVHASPANDSAVTGHFAAKACNVRLTGKCQGSWCEMTHDGTSGWVDTTYIGVFETARKSASASTSAAKTPVTAPVSAATASPAAADPSPPSEPLSAPRVKKPPREPQHAATTRRMGAACVAHVEAGDTLRIRRGPGVNHRAVGGIPPGACGVARSGRCRGAWCRIVWRGQAGWVNTTYLRRDG
jgi:SH3-like domain-containing protein